MRADKSDVDNWACQSKKQTSQRHTDEFATDYI